MTSQRAEPMPTLVSVVIGLLLLAGAVVFALVTASSDQDPLLQKASLPLAIGIGTLGGIALGRAGQPRDTTVADLLRLVLVGAGVVGAWLQDAIGVPAQVVIGALVVVWAILSGRKEGWLTRQVSNHWSGYVMGIAGIVPYAWMFARLLGLL
ncbi:hypothetical protein C5C39_09765 [Rathayibacter sp. AY1F3]|uniref:hypothetical protein n=1 Tax=Rathayibacter sp. AY1F3 TaxID=2080558 RepID=UPI000CE87046|nr:hypothetical protein [Rathayibacter sp. AY1F3]PPG90877.1 hypothetical protein C5C39_09765 [Rathayibacter sp. AY1F3]